jgi:hypothetical protein
MMNTVARILCGSHLYGTNLKGSDKDYKIVYIPEARDILLGRGRSVCESTGPEDMEYMTLQQYMKLLCQGQTNAMDMLFAPDTAHAVHPSPTWRSIQACAAEYWISKNCQAFVGYCRQQVGKYVVKQERFEAFKRIVGYLETLLSQVDEKTRLREVSGSHSNFVQLSSLTEIVDIPLKNGDKVPHLSVCDLKVPLTATIEMALTTYRRKEKEYGARIRSTEATSSKDWKSMYHAVRVAHEAVELLETGKLIFPRPDAVLLVAIRKGMIPFNEVGNMIQQGLRDVEKALETSELREEPDWNAAERFVIHHYGATIRDIAI